MIGERIRRFLMEKGMSLQQLADASGIPLETIRNIYYGRVRDPKISTVLELSKALNVSVDSLVGASLLTEEERELVLDFRKCGNHGRSALLLIARFESTAAMQERNNTDRHRIPCLIPTGALADGIIYNSFRMVDVYTTHPDAFMAIEITSNKFAPTYCKNDRVLLANRVPDHQEQGVFTNGLKAYMRQFLEEGSKYILKSINGRGEDIILKRMDEIECIGTCVGIIRSD